MIQYGTSSRKRFLCMLKITQIGEPRGDLLIVSIRSCTLIDARNSVKTTKSTYCNTEKEKFLETKRGKNRSTKEKSKNS